MAGRSRGLDRAKPLSAHSADADESLADHSRESTFTTPMEVVISLPSGIRKFKCNRPVDNCLPPAGWWQLHYRCPKATMQTNPWRITLTKPNSPPLRGGVIFYRWGFEQSNPICQWQVGREGSTERNRYLHIAQMQTKPCRTPHIMPSASPAEMIIIYRSALCSTDCKNAQQALNISQNSKYFSSKQSQ